MRGSIYTVSYDVPGSENFSFDACYFSEIDSIVFMISATNNFGYSSCPERYTITESDLATSLADIDNEQGIVLYPNPFSDAFYIKGECENIENLTVTDINGRTVKVLNEVKTPTIQVADLPSGMYVVSIKQKQNLKNKYYKLIKK